MTLGNVSCSSQTQSGTGGAGGTGGAASTSSATSSTSSGGTNCSTTPIGTCCDYTSCFTLEQIQGHLKPISGAGGSGGGGGGGNGGGSASGSGSGGGSASGSGGGSGVCPQVAELQTQISFCEWITAGPTVQDGLCCYTVNGGNCCGRPLLVDGKAMVANVVARNDWTAKVHDAPPMDNNTAQALAAAWLEDARFEHASIASFARFTLHLLALGAPADLVEATQRASLDEVFHARACFALASRYAGTPYGPGPMSLGAMTSEGLGPVTLRDAAVAAVLEGCVEETIAALTAAEQYETATDEAVRSTLARIAADEANHAELSWRFVAWALRTGGREVRDAVREAFAAAFAGRPAVEPNVAAPFINEEVFQAHGRLLPAASARVRRDALTHVILPAARTLLLSSPNDVAMETSFVHNQES